MQTQKARWPLIVVKRRYFDAFVSGVKRFEYRRHRPPFTRRAFYPGREVRLAYSYNINRHPARLARVVSFELRRACDCPDLSTAYPDIAATDELAVIELE